jgi:hypothetical protein
MISSPSSWLACSTRSAIWAGCSRASLRYGMRSRAEGTWATKGSMDAKSTMDSAFTCWPKLLPEHAAKEGAPSGVDAHDLPAAVDLGDLDLVGDDEPPAHQVDEMARQQVLGQQQFAGTALEAAQVDLGALEGHAALAQSADLADRHEEVAAFDADHDAHDGRVGVVAEARDQVLDAADPVAGLIEDRPVQERGEVEDFSHESAFTTF